MDAGIEASVVSFASCLELVENGCGGTDQDPIDEGSGPALLSGEETMIRSDMTKKNDMCLHGAPTGALRKLLLQLHSNLHTVGVSHIEERTYSLGSQRRLGSYITEEFEGSPLQMSIRKI